MLKKKNLKELVECDRSLPQQKKERDAEKTPAKRMFLESKRDRSQTNILLNAMYDSWIKHSWHLDYYSEPLE